MERRQGYFAHDLRSELFVEPQGGNVVVAPVHAAGPSSHGNVQLYRLLTAEAAQRAAPGRCNNLIVGSTISARSRSVDCYIIALRRLLI
ncbi:MAG: hypothetical protein LBH06_09265 [Rikenellaceae bacterium]|jgi:hypothetical protein|nr:hypothetical protein [Rikenellaceae bacterium]